MKAAINLLIIDSVRQEMKKSFKLKTKKNRYKMFQQVAKLVNLFETVIHSPDIFCKVFFQKVFEKSLFLFPNLNLQDQTSFKPRFSRLNIFCNVFL